MKFILFSTSWHRTILGIVLIETVLSGDLLYFDSIVRIAENWENNQGVWITILLKLNESQKVFKKYIKIKMPLHRHCNPSINLRLHLSYFSCFHAPHFYDCMVDNALVSSIGSQKNQNNKSQKIVQFFAYCGL